MSLAAFLALLCISKSWPTELTLGGDVVALRLLLFLSHVYGGALLLTCPLLALETLSRQRRALAGPTPADRARPDGGKQPPHGVSFLCCLSVWVFTALDVRWRWTLEEVCASACLHTTKSLLTCLPSLFSPLGTSSCTALTFLLLLVFLYLAVDQRTRCWTSAELAETHKPNRGLVTGLSAGCAGLPQTLVSADVLRVDPEKTVSSCVVLKESAQASAALPRDTAIISPERFPAGQRQERTKGAEPLTYIADAQEERNRCVSGHWGFPCLGLNAVMGLVGVLCIFALPLILSVNIVLVRTVDYLMELSVKALLVSPAADKRSESTSCKATGCRSRCQHQFRQSGFTQAGNNGEIC